MKGKKPDQYFERVRKLTMLALFADDELLEHIVLKGGNVLALLYKMANRTSMDVDASLEEDFPWSLEETEKKLCTAFERVFGQEGLEVFDAKLAHKPKISGKDQDPRFTGYEFTFKVIERERVKDYEGREHRKRAESVAVGPNQERIMKVEFSPYEFITGAKKFEVEGYIIQAYSLALIAVEKLRAICQQFPDYEGRKTKSSRSRDFFDIYHLVAGRHVNFEDSETLALVTPVFNAKSVSLNYLTRLDEVRELHSETFEVLKATVPADIKVESFDFYFDFVKKIAEKLHNKLC